MFVRQESIASSKEVEGPAIPVASPTGMLPCPPVRSDDNDHPYTVEWYRSTKPVVPEPGSLKMFGVEADKTFGEFQSTDGVIKFVNDSGFLMNLYPVDHYLWGKCLTDDMCKRNGILDYVLTGARLSVV